MADQKSEVDRLVEARLEIDQALRQHRVRVSILFSDIVGSTNYFERYGDTAGFVMAHRNADLVSGVVANFQGTTIKTIGDSVMASFEDPTQAVRAAIEVQRTVERLNQTIPAREQTQFRIGISYGNCIRYGKDVYGDAVNLAARITKQCGPAQILISQNAYDAIRTDPACCAKPLGQLELKGKAEKEEVFEVIWSELVPYTELRANVAKALSRGELVSVGSNVDALLKATAGTLEESTTITKEGGQDQQLLCPPHKQLGPYRVLEKLGSGGMGLVYKAEDTRLGRLVALKLLPQELIQNSQALERFKREARAASALDHPNICTIYDIGKDQDQPFIVMQLLEGQTLRQRTVGRPLKTDDLLDLGIQIASALDAAHSKGIVHRDIKPSNIFITTCAQVKILDFGLAKLNKETQKVGGTSKLPTLTPEEFLTNPGVAVGTAAYMSPEQALGEEIDDRSDLFSLGVVFYEMATGTVPFRGSTPAALFNEILNKTPTPPTRLNPGLDPGFEPIIGKALEKEREVRYQTAKDLLADLKRVKRETESRREIAPAERGGFPFENRRAAWLRRALLALTVAILAGVMVWFYAPQSEMVNEENFLPPQEIRPVTTYEGVEAEPALSPDGTKIAFTWSGESGKNPDIYVKLVGDESPLRLTTDPGYEHSPTWSPDGQYVAFFRRSKDTAAVFLVSSLGGHERKLIEATAILDDHLSWSPDGQLLAFVGQPEKDQPQAIFLLTVESGEKRKLTSPTAQSIGDTSPRFSPDGKVLAFTRWFRDRQNEIYIVSTSGGEPRPVRTGDQRMIAGLAWTPNGRELVFGSLDRMARNYSTDEPIFLMRRTAGIWRVQIRGGKATKVALPGDHVGFPSLSLKKNRLTYMQTRSGDLDIWRNVGPKARIAGHSSKLISSTRNDSSPQFSPDGKKIAFSSDRTGSLEIWACDSDGSNPFQLTRLGARADSPRWSPDSKSIAFDLRIKTSSADIYVISAEGEPPRQITFEDSDDVKASWSRDGKWIYFSSNRAGPWQVWKAPAQGGQALQVTKNGGREAFESWDGKFLYFAKGDKPEIWKIPTKGDEEIKVLDRIPQGHWSLLPDGICFLDRTSPATIKFFRFETGEVSEVASLEEHKRGIWFLTASADGQWTLYPVSSGKANSDIMLVENFR